MQINLEMSKMPRRFAHIKRKQRQLNNNNYKQLKTKNYESIP